MSSRDSETTPAQELQQTDGDSRMTDDIVHVGAERRAGSESTSEEESRYEAALQDPSFRDLLKGNSDAWIEHLTAMCRYPPLRLLSSAWIDTELDRIRTGLVRHHPGAEVPMRTLEVQETCIEGLRRLYREIRMGELERDLELSSCSQRKENMLAFYTDRKKRWAPLILPDQGGDRSV